jgi:DNA-binding winged helix-turn-helix (wHTH) protein
MTAMEYLQIRLLGTFEVQRGGEPFTPQDWHSQQTRTILKVLLARRGRAVPSDQLLEILWPGQDPHTTRRRLHVRISQLRRALHPEDPSAFVLTVEGGYSFAAECNCWVDATTFEALAEEGRHKQEEGELLGAIAAYEAARELYRGDFLEEDLYADWAFAERERLRERFLTLLVELAECYAQQGRYRRAITRVPARAAGPGITGLVWAGSRVGASPPGYRPYVSNPGPAKPSGLVFARPAKPCYNLVTPEGSARCIRCLVAAGGAMSQNCHEAFIGAEGIQAPAAIPHASRLRQSRACNAALRPLVLPFILVVTPQDDRRRASRPCASGALLRPQAASKPGAPSPALDGLSGPRAPTF